MACLSWWWPVNDSPPERVQSFGPCPQSPWEGCQAITSLAFLYLSNPVLSTSCFVFLIFPYLLIISALHNQGEIFSEDARGIWWRKDNFFPADVLITGKPYVNQNKTPWVCIIMTLQMGCWPKLIRTKMIKLTFIILSLIQFYYMLKVIEEKLILYLIKVSDFCFM